MSPSPVPPVREVTGSRADICRDSIPGRGDSVCRVPEAGDGLGFAEQPSDTMEWSWEEEAVEGEVGEEVGQQDPEWP